MQNDPGKDMEESSVYRFVSDLRQESLYVSSEKDFLEQLNEKVRLKTEQLLQSTWVTTKKRLLLLPTSRAEFTQQKFYQIASIQSMRFIQAKEVLGFQNAGKIGSLLQILRTQPERLAQWLTIGEKMNNEATHALILQSIVTGLYASIVFPEDVNYMLILLVELAKCQLLKHDNPRRALKQRSSSFESLYFTFHEVLLSSKHFLSGALQVPILRLLTIDFYLDVDVDKSSLRYKHDDNIRALFKSVDDYRKAVVKKLAETTDFFISSLKENSPSFPKPLAWLVYHISKFISESFDQNEANAVLTELLFTMFLCPAIVNPLQYGICDAQITEVASHNLTQIGRIIQNLAMIIQNSADAKTNDVYNMVNRNTVLGLLDDLFSEIKHNNTPPLDVAPFIFRQVAFFTEQEIRTLVTFLQKMNQEVGQRESSAIVSDPLIDRLTTLSLNAFEDTYKTFNGQLDNNIRKSSANLFSLVSRSTSSKSVEDMSMNHRENVLVFSIRSDNIEPLGMLSEGTIIEKNSMKPNGEISPSNTMPENDSALKTGVNYEYQEEESIGNTSDNLEAISEAASNNSLASSLELEENEDQHDNYSDMTSANVSGRGSPNISGRDTPSSQLNENEDRNLQEPRQSLPPNQQQPQQLNPLIQPNNPNHQNKTQQLSRQIRSEIDDKFCKFEIKLSRPLGDETNSLISETWSTDVLASDNENADAADQEQSSNPSNCLSIDQLRDCSETQSESAWSTDAIISDTERLIEDDTGSIAARSDDTNVSIENEDNQSSGGGCSSFPTKQPHNKDRNANVILKSEKSDDKKDEASSSNMLLSNSSLNSSSSSGSELKVEPEKHPTGKQEHQQLWLNTTSQTSLNVVSTPSESPSELSVLSVTNLMMMKDKKPNISRGAIPKSISFDISAEEEARSAKNNGKSPAGFFGKLRMGFRNRRGKSMRRNNEDDEALDVKATSTRFTDPSSSDQILEKYRTKGFEGKIPVGGDSTCDEPEKERRRSRNFSESTIISNRGTDGNSTFRDVKNKLRMVLSDSTVQLPGDIEVSGLPLQSKIETILRIELGKARKLRQWSNVARISETLRCIRLLDDKNCVKLVTAMKDDILKRSMYVQYLVSSKKDLLWSETFLNGLQEQVTHEGAQCSEYLAQLYIDDVMRSKEMELQDFCLEFKQSSLSDEKYDILNSFISQLYDGMKSHPAWTEIFGETEEAMKMTLERFVIGRVYDNALYPNGDCDRERDRVLREHIKKLSAIINPDHKYLMIQKEFQREAPWLPAQEALKSMSAYRTPREKVNCIFDCSKSIMDLLGIARTKRSTTADDFTPVLVYVIIKTNPKHLLSTVQFVNNFYQNQLYGEQQYWWIQFCSAVEFIKTMDYSY